MKPPPLFRCEGRGGTRNIIHHLPGADPLQQVLPRSQAGDGQPRGELHGGRAPGPQEGHDRHPHLLPRRGRQGRRSQPGVHQSL